MADICYRNGKTKLIWFGNKEKTLNYSPANDEMLITVHRWFANKACPGDYIYNRLPEIVDSVNEILDSNADVKAKISESKESVYYKVRKSWGDTASQIGAYVSEENAKINCPYGYKVFDSTGKVVYENNAKPTNEEPKGIPSSKEDYLEKVSSVAVELAKKYKILPSVVIAQTIIENGWGLAEDCKVLTEVSNILGMKVDLINSTWGEYSVWNGEYITKKTPEYYNGKLTYINDQFRKYSSYKNCLEDYMNFLLHVKKDANTLKYADVQGKTNPNEVITIISSRGYSTSPYYVSSIMRIISENNLTKYDVQAGMIDDSSLSIPTTTVSYYRVAEDYKNGEYIGQIGAYTSRDNALASGKASNLNVYDASGKVIHQATKIENRAYRVRCGRFSVKQNATNLVNTLASNGIGSLLVKDGDEWDVQVGLFNVKENAEAYEKEIKNRGFDVMIVEIEG